MAVGNCALAAQRDKGDAAVRCDEVHGANLASSERRRQIDEPALRELRTERMGGIMLRVAAEARLGKAPRQLRFYVIDGRMNGMQESGSDLQRHTQEASVLLFVWPKLL